jgi:hypothetical protein
MAALSFLLDLSPPIYIILSVLVAVLILLLRMKDKLRTGLPFVLADALLATVATLIGQIDLYSEHATLNGIVCLGIPSLAVAAAVGGIQARLTHLALDPKTTIAARDNAIIGVVLLGIPVGLVVYGTLILFAFWASG